ncbi:MAG: cellulase family glycosylhydrolase [Bacteroidales bacterium]|nr:cellulase family glycosylhydrolase [Bacteroidales bacterium]
MEKKSIDRRQFVKSAAALAALGVIGAGCGSKPVPDITASSIPRWRGFNLLEKFIVTSSNDPFKESDFEMMAELGFDFVRLPMSYWCWSDPKDWRKLDEKILKEIDQAVEFGKQYGIHVSINFHRAPGYSVDRSAREPFNLWLDEEAQQAFDYHWSHFAQRYKGIPNKNVSFNLVNEPATIDFERTRPLTPELHAKVVRRVVKAIRDVDPNRLIIADGLWWGRDPAEDLADLNIVQSTRGYEPSQITHYLASWVDGADKWPVPSWPFVPELSTELRYLSDEMNEYYTRKLEKWGIPLGMEWNSERIRLQMIEPWKKLQSMGVGVHVGEFGAFSRTPHDVVLAWLRELMGQWKEAGWGWAMWNFRGGFGILDSQRTDVQYEDYKGHKLDRKMLELIKEF